MNLPLVTSTDALVALITIQGDLRRAFPDLEVLPVLGNCGDPAVIAHALAVINNRLFAGQLNAERAAVLALYHDASEVLTGDMPTPIKYHNPDIAREFKKIEEAAAGKDPVAVELLLRAEVADPSGSGDRHRRGRSQAIG